MTATTQAIPAAFDNTSMQTEQRVLLAVRASKAGMGLTQLAKHLKLPRAALRTTVAALALSNRLHAVGEGEQLRYRVRSQPSQTPPRATPYLRCSYAGTELLRAPGVTAGRFVAFDLPSRVGERLYFPDGRVTRLDGSALA